MTAVGKTALITGITGQDGAYLARLLLGKEYRVIGVRRSARSNGATGLKFLGIEDRIDYRDADLANANSVMKLLESVSPDEVYNLGAKDFLLKPVEFKKLVNLLSGIIFPVSDQ